MTATAPVQGTVVRPPPAELPQMEEAAPTDAATEQVTLRILGSVVVLTTPIVAIFAGLLAVAICLPLVYSAKLINLLALFCLVPACCFAVWAFFFRRDVVRFRQLFARFALSWLGLTPVALFIGCIVMVLWIFLVSMIAAVLRFPGWLLMLLIILGAIASFIFFEEMVKLLVLQKSDSYANMTNPRHYTLFNCATALGMGSCEAYYWVLLLRSMIDAAVSAQRHAATHAPTPVPPHGGMAGDYNPGGGRGGLAGAAVVALHRGFAALSMASEDEAAAEDMQSAVKPGMMISLIIATVFFIIPMHVLASYHIGLAVARVQVLQQTVSPYFPIMGALLVRTSFICALFFGNELFNGADWVLGVIIIVVYAIVVKAYEKHMPRQYLEQAGYMSFFGYGLLPSGDEEAATGAPDENSGSGRPARPAPVPESHNVGVTEDRATLAGDATGVAASAAPPLPPPAPTATAPEAPAPAVVAAKPKPVSPAKKD